MRGFPLKAFPLGGRWHGEAVTDEGAISPQSLPLGGKVPPKGADEGAGFGLGSLYAGGFRRLRAASSFARGGKGTKTPPGTAQDERSALIFAFPRTPFTGVTP